MSTIRAKLKEILDVLSDLNNPPPAAAGLSNALDVYLKLLNEAKQKHAAEEKMRELFAELVNSSEAAGRRKLETLSDADFKKFCAINGVPVAKAKKEIRVKGKITQKAIKAKAATKKRSAQAAIPEAREADTIIPAQSARQVTTESALHQAFQLKSQTTL